MAISNWLFGTCGRSHIGIYVCSRCGYELLRSGFERNFVLKSPKFEDLLPLVPVTVAAAKGTKGGGENSRTKSSSNAKASNIISRTPFNNSMLEDFTKNANLRTYHKNSLVKRILEGEEKSHWEGIPSKPQLDTKDYEISCGKCGSSLGHQRSLLSGATSNTQFFIKKDTIDLQFRST